MIVCEFDRDIDNILLSESRGTVFVAINVSIHHVIHDSLGENC